MSYEAKFYSDQQSITVGLAPDFIPPSALSNALMSDGLSSNRLSGGRKFDEKYVTRNWSFSVRVYGSTEAGVRASVMRLVGLLASATERNQVYFGFRANADVPAPVWGEFGQWRTYAIKHATYALDNNYFVGDVRQEYISVSVNLTIAPFAEGAKTYPAEAHGAVDVNEIGLRVDSGRTNYVLNPSFESGLNYAALGGGSVSRVITTKKHNTYAVLVAGHAVGDGVSMTLSALTNAVHAVTFWAYGNIPPDVEVSLNSGTTYYDTAAIETDANGWTRYSAIVAAAHANGSTQLRIRQNTAYDYSWYIDCVQVEPAAFPSYWFDGDSLGGAWSGTRNESTSTRGDGVVLYSHFLSWPSHHTVRLVWRCPAIVASYSADFYLFNDNGLILLYDVGAERFEFTDGTNTAYKAATLATNTDFVIHCVSSPGALNIYVNGAIGTPAADHVYDATTGPLYIGRTTTAALYSGGYYRMFNLIDAAMTAAEVALDYAEIASANAEHDAVDPIPLFYNPNSVSDGLGLYNCNDTTYRNYGVFMGITGTAPAKKTFYLQTDTLAGGYWFGGIDVPYGQFVHPTLQWFADNNTTADAAYCGGGYSSIADGSESIYQTVDRGELANSRHNYFLRASRASGTAAAELYAALAVGYQKINLDSLSKTTFDTTNRIYYCGTYDMNRQIYADRQDDYGGGYYNYELLSWAINISSGTTAKVDFAMDIPGKLMFITFSAGAFDTLVVNDESCVALETQVIAGEPTTRGELPDIIPGRMNYVWSLVGADEEAHLLNDIVEVGAVITPRWSLL